MLLLVSQAIASLAENKYRTTRETQMKYRTLIQISYTT